MDALPNKPGSRNKLTLLKTEAVRATGTLVSDPAVAAGHPGMPPPPPSRNPEALEDVLAGTVGKGLPS